MPDIQPFAKDDLVAAFQIENVPVRGRVARLGELIDEVLTRHAYPEPVPTCWAKPAPWRPWSAPA